MQKFNLSIRVNIFTEVGTYGGLEVSETVTIQASGFMELCKVLSQFHELGEKLKSEGGK